MSQRTISLLPLLALLTAPLQAAIERLALKPEAPTTGTEVWLAVSGTATSSCDWTPGAVTRNGFSILIEGRSRPGPCLDVVRPYEEVFALGFLPAGTYTVAARDSGGRFAVGVPIPGTTFFTVAPTGLGCVPRRDVLCIDDVPGDGRFQVRLEWKTSQGDGPSGAAQAVSLASVDVTRGGLFWFFDPSNPELTVKVLDGCGVNGQYWVFASALTNVGTTLSVVDTVSGRERVYESPDRTVTAPVQDVTAFPCR